ncbi:Uncharacterized protein APZ42_021528 [Daphnia magna]|uniref:Uncharacterized protein n=1 Tax=Daphnia magna TaxID=35525 RepID=A0A164WL42_9CRUS|nr:Uncharacterized protein APZ42_021528 [Daphnia magna]
MGDRLGVGENKTKNIERYSGSIRLLLLLLFVCVCVCLVCSSLLYGQ